MAWNEQPPRPEDDRPGCLDAIVLTRMAFGILFWPVAALVAAAAAVAIGILLLASYPLATIAGGIAIAIAGTVAWRLIRARRRRPGA